MGASGSIPDVMTKEEAKELAGENFNEAAFDKAAVDGKVTRAQVLVHMEPPELQELWKLFDPLLASAPDDDPDSHKMLGKEMKFDQTKDFMKGLDTGKLTRSMRQEFEENEGGKWKAEFEYVVDHPAIEVREKSAAIEEQFAEIGLRNGAINKRDVGHSGMKLKHFMEHEMAKKAKMSPGEMAAVRLYTGPSYVPLNGALRSKKIEAWKTTIALCYSGVIKLSMLQEKQERVYRDAG